MIVLQMALSPLIQLSFLGKSWSQIPCDHDTSMTHLNDTWLTSHDNQIISDHLRSSHPIMTIITSQAESPLDKQIKSSLLADAFNLLGVRRLDAQTLTSARLRARFLCLGKVNLLGNDKVMMSGFWSDFMGIF
jgi:hypothetical protein